MQHGTVHHGTIYYIWFKFKWLFDCEAPPTEDECSEFVINHWYCAVTVQYSQYMSKRIDFHMINGMKDWPRFYDDYQVLEQQSCTLFIKHSRRLSVLCNMVDAVRLQMCCKQLQSIMIGGLLRPFVPRLRDCYEDDQTVKLKHRYAEHCHAAFAWWHVNQMARRHHSNVEVLMMGHFVQEFIRKNKRGPKRIGGLHMLAVDDLQKDVEHLQNHRPLDTQHFFVICPEGLPDGSFIRMYERLPSS